MSKQEDFHRSEKLLEKTQEIDSEVRISEKTKMKRKFNRNQKGITPWNIQLSSLIFLVKLKKLIIVFELLNFQIFFVFQFFPFSMSFLYNLLCEEFLLIFRWLVLFWRFDFWFSDFHFQGEHFISLERNTIGNIKL